MIRFDRSVNIFGVGRSYQSENMLCSSVGKSVSLGLDKSYAAKGKDMQDLMAFDDAAVVLPHNGNYPLPCTDAFRTVPVIGSCHVGLGFSGSTELQVIEKKEALLVVRTSLWEMFGVKIPSWLVVLLHLHQLLLLLMLL